ncbi:TPM domain-containing protein [Isosphaeraceae bacterium EP7]
MNALSRRLAYPALALALAATIPASAATIRDGANMFGADALREANKILEKAERDNNIPITVETVETINGRNIETVLPERARSEGIRGFYILIAKKEAKVEVGASSEYSKAVTRPHRLATRDAIVAQFKARDFDAGLIDGSKVAARELSEAKATARTTAPVPAGRGNRNAPVPRQGGGLPSWLPIVLLLVGGFLAFRLIKSLFGGGQSAGGYMRPGPGGMGGPAQGPGYGGGYGGGGGGGMFGNIMGSIGGAMAGNWIYDQMSGRRSQGADYGGSTPIDSGPAEAGPDWSTSGDGGGDWGGGGGDGGGDWGGGGGGGDWGGGGGDGGGSW